MSSTSGVSSVATISTALVTKLRRWLALLLLGPGLVAAEAPPSGVVLEYHHVAKDTPPSTSIDPETFKAQMDYLADNGFEVWSLPRLVETVRAGEPVPAKTVALTFDDAYKSVYEEVWPRLKRRGWPFTVFVTPGYIDDEGQNNFVSWDQLREMAAGGVTIANHSQTHAHFVHRRPRESRDSWLQRIRWELREAQKRLEAELADPAELHAYPYGEFAPPVQSVVEELGFVAFGQQSGAFGPDSDYTALPRFPIATGFASLDSFGVKVNSRPLPVKSTEPESGVVSADTVRPELRITLEPDTVRPSRVNCYVGGRPAEVTVAGEDPPVVAVQPQSPIGSGRTKYNCTAPPSDNTDGWHWFSFLWMKPRPDGTWYKE